MQQTRKVLAGTLTTVSRAAELQVMIEEYRQAAGANPALLLFLRTPMPSLTIGDSLTLQDDAAAG
ncbi:hypothetical protein CBOM_08137 [Ceraceosorus bombacis]|uniref:Uncharacterized protein n=1 Tax=Ceraceosorus bombacis TaxID=401625 RepID=A0A0N7L8T4_9BASI|nr:hypothetical protein CBOM_08137 [Ceraceosorus bombacis]